MNLKVPPSPAAGSHQPQHQLSTRKRFVVLDPLCPISWPSISSENAPAGPFPLQERCPEEQLLRRCYLECLWLGEHHFPLTTFPQAFDRLPRAFNGDGGALTAAKVSLDALATLLRGRDALQRKYRTEIPAALGQAADPNRLESYMSESLSAAPGIDRCELGLIVKALQSGAGAAVAAEMRSKLSPPAPQLELQDEELGQPLTVAPSEPPLRSSKLQVEWLNAIERRELSLQLLIVLEILRLLAEQPALLASSCPPTKVEQPGTGSKFAVDEAKSQGSALTSQPASSHLSVVGDEGGRDSSDLPGKTEEPRKKKRKTAPARRWTGFPTAFGLNPASSLDEPVLGFPWQKTPAQPLQTPTEGSLLDDDDDVHALVRDAERLHKLYEAIADRLSMRIITAELAKDVAAIGDLTEEAPTDAPAQARPSASSTPLFGTSARKRDERDERDEMYFLCSDIVEARFSRILPRQCAVLRARSTVHSIHSGMTPKATRNPGSQAEAQSDRRASRHELELARARRESDLSSRSDAAEARNRQREARRLSQRPDLRDVLVTEQKERQSRASSVAADAERSRREVSVKRRIGFSRAASSSNPQLGGGLSMPPQAPTQRVFSSRSMTGNSQPRPPMPPSRVSKRKVTDPQRFGGLLSQNTSVKGNPIEEADSDSENPFRDTSQTVKPLVASSSSDQMLGSSAMARKNGPDNAVPGSRRPLQPRPTAHPESQPLRRSQLGDNVIRSTGVGTGWQRTESQPVTSRDLSALRDSSSVASDSLPASGNVSETDTDDDEWQEPSTNNKDHDGDEEDAIFSFRRAPSISQATVSAPRPLHGLSALRGWSKAKSFGPSSSLVAIEAMGDAATSGREPQSQTVLDTLIPVQLQPQPQSQSQSQTGVPLATGPSDPQRATERAQRSPTGSRTDKRSSLLSRSNVFARTPSGRNPFAKSASANASASNGGETKSRPSLLPLQPQSQIAGSDQPSSQELSRDKVASGFSQSSSGSDPPPPTSAAELGRLWRGARKWED
ncbi:unnamed protein product [Parajaminaea phylloscopi]